LSVDIVTPNPAAGSYTITIPALTKNNVAFSRAIPFGTPFSLDVSGYKLEFGNNNSFEVTIALEILSTAPPGVYSFNTISFSNVVVQGVYGYFGQQRVSPSPVSLNVSTFDKFRNNSTTELRIKEAFLAFRVDNGAGFPIQLRIDEVKTSVSGGSFKIENNVDSATISSNKLHESYARTERHIGGEALGKVLSNMPSEVEFKFSAAINPEGSNGGTVKNFLTDASSITVSNIEALIPLDFSVNGMVLRDTLNFNASRVTFKDMELRANIENNMPVAVILQAYLMDEESRDLGVLFKEPVSIPAATVDDATGRVIAPYPYKKEIEANVEELAQAKKLKVEITVNTDLASGYVRVTKDNYVYLKMGAKAKVNIDNLD
jgi:hypothetical protein